jgi:hypothetical protein
MKLVIDSEVVNDVPKILALRRVKEHPDTVSLVTLKNGEIEEIIARVRVGLGTGKINLVRVPYLNEKDFDVESGNTNLGGYIRVLDSASV